MKQQISLYLPPPLWEEVEEFSKEHSLTKAAAIRYLLSVAFESMRRQ